MKPDLPGQGPVYENGHIESFCEYTACHVASPPLIKRQIHVPGPWSELVHTLLWPPDIAEEILRDHKPARESAPGNKKFYSKDTWNSQKWYIKKSCHCLGEKYGIDLIVKRSVSFYSPSLKTLLQSYKIIQPSIPQVASKRNRKTPIWQPLLTPRCTSAPIFNHPGSDKMPNDCSYMIPQGRSTEGLPSRSQYKFQVSKQLF